MPRNQYPVSCIKYFVSIALVFAAVYLLHTTNNVLLAASPLETAQSDYNFQSSQFRNVKERFANAKAAYISFKTAASKDQAFSTSKEYLTQASTLYIAYYALVKEYGNSLDWSDKSDVHTKLATTMDDASTYFLQVKDAVTRAQTLEDLTKIAADIDKNLKDKFDPQTYYTLANYELASGKQLYRQFLELAQKLGESKQSFANSSTLLNWQTEIDDIKAKSTISINSAQDQLDHMPQTRVNTGEVEQIKKAVDGTKKELLRAKPLFLEAAKLF